MRKAAWGSIFLILFASHLFAEDSISPTVRRQRKIVLSSATAGLSVGSLVLLNQAWYSQYNTGSFHFFNDNAEWLQMDKAGHFYTTYQTSRLMMDAFRWAGYEKKYQVWVGGGIGFCYMTAIELMDGFSRGWGYSWGDQVADIAGSALAMSQEQLWHEQRLQLKFSYAESGLAKFNPGLLGDSKYSRLLKDYNGQTYWLSLGPASFVAHHRYWPAWLNIALGYSAYGMLGGHYNRILAQDEGGNIYKMDRERRFYLSLDIDLDKIKTKSVWLRSAFRLLNILKFPAPTLQFSQKVLRFYGLYY